MSKPLVKALLGSSLLSMAAAASASIVFTFDTPYVTVVRPSAGVSTATLVGTIDVSEGYQFSAYELTFPTRQNEPDPVLDGFLHSDFWDYVYSSFPGLDYHGNVLTVEVPSGVPYGFYAFRSGGSNPVFLQLEASDATGAWSSSTAEYGIHVVPEPATLAALGAGLGLWRRRRKRRLG